MNNIQEHIDKIQYLIKTIYFCKEGLSPHRIKLITYNGGVQLQIFSPTRFVIEFVDLQGDNAEERLIELENELKEILKEALNE